MALDTAIALTDLATAKSFLKVVGQSSDAKIEDAINAASIAIEFYCNRPFKQRALSNVRMTGPRGARLPLRAVPIKTDAAVTVSVDEVAQTVWRTEADGDPATFDVMVASFNPESGAGPDHLYRANGWMGSQVQPYNVLLTYTGGFVTIPAPIAQACCYVVQKLFRDSDRQLAEVAQINTPMGGISLIDNALPLFARRVLLDPYKFPEAA